MVKVGIATSSLILACAAVAAEAPSAALAPAVPVTPSTAVSEAAPVLKAAMDPGHTFYFPTAIQKPKGTTALKGYYLGFWDIEHTFNDNLSAGVAVLVPIGAYVIAPFVKPTIQLGPKLRVGAYASAGTIRAGIGDNDSLSYVQGGPLVTLGDESGAVTAGFLLQRGGDSKGQVAFNLSGFYPMTDHHMLIVESYTTGDDDRTTLLGYGLRYGGDTLSADVGFILPIGDETDEFLDFAPIGIPFVSINFIL